jgi:hypothetical protein
LKFWRVESNIFGAVPILYDGLRDLVSFDASIVLYFGPGLSLSSWLEFALE